VRLGECPVFEGESGKKKKSKLGEIRKPHIDRQAEINSFEN